MNPTLTSEFLDRLDRVVSALVQHGRGAGCTSCGRCGNCAGWGCGECVGGTYHMPDCDVVWLWHRLEEMQGRRDYALPEPFCPEPGMHGTTACFSSGHQCVLYYSAESKQYSGESGGYLYLDLKGSLEIDFIDRPEPAGWEPLGFCPIAGARTLVLWGGPRGWCLSHTGVPSSDGGWGLSHTGVHDASR